MITVKLTQLPYIDGSAESPCFRAAGYLSTDDQDEETGPTVTVRWYGDDQDAIAWDKPDAVEHYSLGDITEATAAILNPGE
jgi:hypothetical protein